MVISKRTYNLLDIIGFINDHNSHFKFVYNDMSYDIHINQIYVSIYKKREKERWMDSISILFYHDDEFILYLEKEFLTLIRKNKIKTLLDGEAY